MNIFHKDIIEHIENFASPQLQESYDNSGWQVGDPNGICTGVIINLDVTEDVVEEAISSNLNLIIVHHPIIFTGIKSLTGEDYIQRILIKAIQNNISIYACHTNIDNIHNGVNSKIADKLGISDFSILMPRAQTLMKLRVNVPLEAEDIVKEALFNAGAGQIGHYSECAFSSIGIGSFKPNSGSNPTIGRENGPREYVEESIIEVILPFHLKHKVINAIKKSHPYEEVAYDLIPLNNDQKYFGAGGVGMLPQPLLVEDFLQHVKTVFNTDVIKYTDFNKKIISKIAWCGGSGSFLLNAAIRSECDAFITSDFKYHQFFDGDKKIMIADIGHYETEQYTSEIFYDIIKDNFPTFAVRISNILSNPVKYYF